ncbi:hypothetical protein TNCT_135801 [Trichonephila clavata]|uniref:Uncharacterized protein n=1 Tax=Trichonephila clavata TaxID=2740835 RepID=A0A8X6HZ50_TRICU|nr:hypothetical protein TNCT_135801 [Trichonephila clavata]
MSGKCLQMMQLLMKGSIEVLTICWVSATVAVRSECVCLEHFDPFTNQFVWEFLIKVGMYLVVSPSGSLFHLGHSSSSKCRRSGETVVESLAECIAK